MSAVRGGTSSAPQTSPASTATTSSTAGGGTAATPQSSSGTRSGRRCERIVLDDVERPLLDD